MREVTSYDRIFDWHVATRSRTIGVRDVMDWARPLRPGSTIVDLGCGDGLPIARALIDAGHEVCGIDTSPKMTAAFRANCPGARAETAPVEESDYFGLRFDGIVAWGVLFFLPAPAQEAVIARVATALRPGGRLLFTAPRQAVTWDDTMNGVTFGCVSLGASTYARLIGERGLTLIDEHTDAWGNDYYGAVKPEQRRTHRSDGRRNDGPFRPRAA